MIMEAQDTDKKSADSLVFEISKKIPGEERRQEFLRRWQVMSDSRKKSGERKEPQVFPEKGRSHPLLEEVLHKISNEIAHVVEPISKTFRRQEADKTDKVD